MPDRIEHGLAIVLANVPALMEAFGGPRRVVERVGQSALLLLPFIDEVTCG